MWRGLVRCLDRDIKAAAFHLDRSAPALYNPFFQALMSER
jgi:hypothetical protein